MNISTILFIFIFVLITFPHEGNAGFFLKKKKEEALSFDSIPKQVNLDLNKLKDDLLTLTWVSVPILNLQEKANKKFKCDEQVRYNPDNYMESMHYLGQELFKPLKSLVPYFSPTLKAQWDQLKSKDSTVLLTTYPYFYFQSEVIRLFAEHVIPKEIYHMKALFKERALIMEQDYQFLQAQLQTLMKASMEAKLTPYVNHVIQRNQGQFEIQLQSSAITVRFPTFVNTDSYEKRNWEPGFGLQKARKVQDIETWIRYFKGYQIQAFKYLIYSSLQEHCKDRQENKGFLTKLKINK